MTNARREGLYTALISDYQTKLGAVKTAIDAVEAQVMQNYPGIDVFGPASQTIAKSILDNTASDPNNRNYPPALMPIYNAGCANVTPYVINVGGTLYGCTTGNYCNGVPGTCPLRTPLAGDPPVTTQDSQQYVGNLDAWGWDASHAFLPAEYKVAAALKLDGPVSGGRGRDLQHYVFAWRLAGSSGALDASPGWSSVSNGVSSGNLDVEVWWNPNNNADMAPRSSSNAELQPFYAPGDNRGMTLVATRRFALSMTTNNQCGYSLTPYQALGNRWQRVNAACLDCSCTSVNGQTMYDHFFDAHSPDLTNSSPQTYVWTASTIVDQGSLSTVRAEIEDKLKSLQYQIYDSIANALADSSNNLGVKNAADLATVPIKAIDAYASLGVPESLRRSEILRGILRGNELGLDRAAMYRYYRSLADGIQAGTRLTARPQPFWDPSPSVSSVARTRSGYLQNEIHAIVTANRPEQPPMMQWAMAELTHLQNNVARTASDDRYVMRRSATSLQVAPPGVLANDQPAPRPAGQAAILRATLYSVPPPGAGSVVLNQDGGFSYTPPSPLPANLTSVTFQYQASASLVPPSTNLGDMVTSNVVTVTIDIADDCVPTIVAQPQATEFALNGSATFFVRADAQERVTYRWYRDGVALTDTAFGACCLPDGSCSVADQPSCAHLGGDWHGQGTVCGGLQVCYSCPLAACPPPPTATIVSGARTPLLSISNLHTADRGTYTCVVSSSCGSVATSAARLGSCPADFNNSGVLEVQDIFDFLNAWFAGNLSADFNNSGVLEVQDIFDFLNAWFAGC
jgi:hypothetical protein